MTLRKSKITNHSSLKTQQTTIKFKQPSLQYARHPIHRVRIPYSKFSSPKTCHNVHENSLVEDRTFEINTIGLLLKRA